MQVAFTANHPRVHSETNYSLQAKILPFLSDSSCYMYFKIYCDQCLMKIAPQCISRIGIILTFPQLMRQSLMKYSDAPFAAQFSFVRPGCALLSRNLIRSRNNPRSSGDNAAIILKIYTATQVCKFSFKFQFDNPKFL